VPALFEEVELGAFQMDQSVGLRRWRRAAMWAKYAHHLRALRRYYRAFTVVSEPERRLLAAVLGDPRAIHLVPNGVAAAEYGSETDAARPDTLVFAGSLRYGPNYDAMRWFLSRVWPRVRQARPAARLLITGAHGDLPLPAAENVVRTGFVQDIRPLLASSWLAVAPILSGGGTRIKILEAMASCTPVVATTKGAEGIAAIGGEHVLLADDPSAFAEHVLALLGDASLRARLGRAGRALVEDRYDWRVLGRQFEALVRAVAAT
jgi:glycosyltransferase involved in cell wall biosynthesis